MKSNKTDRGISAVIGIILMVAITVILAAVIGTFVLGLGSEVPSHPMNYEVTSSGEHVLLEYEKLYPNKAPSEVTFQIHEVGNKYTIKGSKDRGLIVLKNYDYNTINIVKEYKGDKFVEASYVRINNKWESVD